MLLPGKWIENSIEAYLYQRTTVSQKIYWIVLVAVSVTLLSLPFIYVDITVQGSGVIRPVAEKTEIVSPLSELVDSVFIREGAQVKRGDVILRFRTNQADYNISYQSGRLSDYEAHIADLYHLSKGERPKTFHSPVRQREYTYYVQRRLELATAIEQAEKEYQREKILYEKLLISTEEYEKYYYQYESRKNELSSYEESQLSTWQADLNTYRNSHGEMQTALRQEMIDKDMCILRSPVNGTVDQFTGIYRGSSLQAGQSLAIISPDSTLYIETYVRPKDIGYMYIGMPVNVQVESFDYNQWGSISGEVTDISSDFLTDKQGNSFYKVKCSMKKDYLTLKNGVQGKLKKGMSVAAHFRITRRSLFDLLYQKIDDWINPAQYRKVT